MEPDRYQKNHKLYIFGMLCLLVSLSLLFFTVYLFPHLIFGWRYDVPEFITFWREWIMSSYGVSTHYASRLIFLFFFVGVLLFGLGAYFGSTRIDNEIYGINQEHAPERIKKTRDLSESFQFFLKALGIIVLFYFSTIVFEWLISAPPP